MATAEGFLTFLQKSSPADKSEIPRRSFQERQLNCDLLMKKKSPFPEAFLAAEERVGEKLPFDKACIG